MFDFLKKINKEDVAMLGVSYIVSGWSILGTTIIVSYNFDPLKHIRKSKIFQWPFIQNTYHKIENFEWISALTNKISKHPRKLNRAIVESLFITHLATPITTTLQIALAYKMVEYIKGEPLIKDDIEDP